MPRKLAPRRSRKPVKRARPHNPVQTVVDETIALYQWLSWVADDLYGDDARGAARRWTLRRLWRYGPQSVPALAKVRAVRRQSLQPLIDSLLADGLVELAINPANARSHLVRVTTSGSDLVDRLDRIDNAVLRAVGRGIGESDLAITAATLQALRSAFETKMRWRPAAVSALGRSELSEP